MRLSFDIKEHDRIYNVLVMEHGWLPDCFWTDDCIEIDEDEGNFEMIVNLFPDVKFKEI